MYTRHPHAWAKETTHLTHLTNFVHHGMIYVTWTIEVVGWDRAIAKTKEDTNGLLSLSRPDEGIERDVSLWQSSGRHVCCILFGFRTQAQCGLGS